MDNYPRIPQPVPPPLPPKKEEGMGKYALLIGGGCLLLLIFAAAAGFFFYYIFKATGDPLNVVNQQLTAMREGDLEKAYSLCSNGFKQITNYENFQSFVDGNPKLKNSKKFTSYNRAIESGTAKLKGNLVSNEGSKTPAEYHLVKEGKGWKVQFIDLGSAGVDQRSSDDSFTRRDVQNEGGTPGEPAKEKGVLENLFGDEPSPSDGLRVQNVNIEKGKQGDLDMITIRFKVFGFHTDRSGAQPRMHIVQDLQTFGPDGNLIPELSKDAIKVLDDIGTFEYADLWNSLSVPSSYPRGRYECRLTVHDKVSGQDTVATTQFDL